MRTASGIAVVAVMSKPHRYVLQLMLQACLPHAEQWCSKLDIHMQTLSKAPQSLLQS